MRKTLRVIGWIGGLALLLVLVQCGHSRLSYSAICARCLQHVSGSETLFLGIVIQRSEQTRQGHGGLMSPDIFGPSISSLDAKLHEEITGKPCLHAFMRTGFCRYSGGGVGCGSFGAGRRYAFRNAIVERTYSAYLRTKDPALARETLALLDAKYPVLGANARAELPTYQPPSVQAKGQDELSALHDGLGLLTSAEEWRSLLASLRSGSTAAVLSDTPLLIARLSDPSTEVATNAVAALVACDQAGAWAAIAAAMARPDLRNAAASAILAGRQFSYWPQALGAGARSSNDRSTVSPDWPFESFITENLGSLSDAELRTLLAQRDPLVDLVCFRQIRADNRSSLLDEVLRALNDRRSESAALTVEELLAGPDPFRLKNEKGGSARNPLAWLLQNTSFEFVENMALTRSGQRAYRMQQETARLARAPALSHWQKLQDLARQWRSQGGAELHFAAIAEAMHACDVLRTREWLLSELAGLHQDEARAVPVLCAMGAIADPVFLPAIEEFAAKSRITTMGNPYYRVPFQYAQHRCRGMDRWRLAVLPTGEAVIERP